MKVAFVSGNREKLPDAVVPYGILCVIANIPKHHSITLLDLCFEDEPGDVLSQHLRELQPDVVALGMRNIQNADYSGISHTLDYYAGLVERIRGATEAPIVMGGSGFSIMPQDLMARLRPDFGISGEAELAFPALLSALEKREGMSDIGSLHYFENDELVTNPAPKQFLDMNTLPLPDRSFVDTRYHKIYGIESLQTKRGCPLRCDYCTYPIIEGRVGRTREPSAVVDELFAIAEQGPDINHIFIVDSVFNLPKGHAKSVCREMIARETKLPFTCYVNPLGFDEELAKLMVKAGCAGMEVGSDSGSDEILLRLRKGFTTDHIRNLHRVAEQTGLPDCHTFLLATPGETFDDVLRTLDFIVDLDPFSAILMPWVDDYESLDPERAKQRQALRDATLEILDDHKSDFPWWSIPTLGVNYDPKLFDTLRSHGFHGPLWQHLRGLAPADAAGKRQRRIRHPRPTDKSRR